MKRKTKKAAPKRTPPTSPAFTLSGVMSNGGSPAYRTSFIDPLNLRMTTPANLPTLDACFNAAVAILLKDKFTGATTAAEKLVRDVLEAKAKALHASTPQPASITFTTC